LAATLNHPSIARVIGWGIDAGRAYLATELVVGVTLREMVDAQVYEDACELQLPRTVRQRVELIVPVAEALGFAHANNVVHRDVKPSNIMVKPGYVPKLIDFGIAVATHSQSQRITRTGVFVGSHNYAAPEQLVGDKDEVGPWTDTYALGVTLYELLTLRTPFVSPTFVARASRAKEKPPHRARYYNKDIPRALDALVMRALSPKPRKRFCDGAAMAAALRAWLRKSK
jgi:serine/threonine-protein kinase